jgi:hypothetical protein
MELPPGASPFVVVDVKAHVILRRFSTDALVFVIQSIPLFTNKCDVHLPILTQKISMLEPICARYPMRVQERNAHFHNPVGATLFLFYFFALAKLEKNTNNKS